MNYNSQHASFCSSAAQRAGKQNCRTESRSWNPDPCSAIMATAQVAEADRTIVVCGIPEGCLSDDIMADILIIHFQKQKNKGADVEKVVYPTSTRGIAYVTFEDKQAAENVLTQVEHCLEDRRLRQAYPLKISSYGKSIFTCVTCELDLSTFGEKAELRDLVEDLKMNLTALNFGPLQPSKQITVQGPFSAINALQNTLLSKVKHILSEQHDKRKGSAPDHTLNVPGFSKAGLSSNSSSDFAQHQLQDRLIVVTDTDIYSYMKKFKGGQYQRYLKQCGAASLEHLDGEVTSIYLNNDSTKSGPSQLAKAKTEIEGLLAELQDSLRKKRFSLEGFKRAEIRKCQQACEVVSTQYPHVLVISYPTHIDIIGSSSHIYNFAQEMNKIMRDVHREPWR